MRRVVLSVVVIGLNVLAAGGCRGRQQRPYDPFSAPPQARANRSPVETESLLSPADSHEPEVAHAGAEYTPAADERRDAIRPRRGFRPPAENDLDIAAVPDKPRAIAEGPRSSGAMDHAPDYSWIQGRLEYSALGGGIWKVRYAPISDDDEHGGSVILESAPDDSQFQPGDTVYVDGRISASNQRRSLQNPLYQVHRMRIVEE
jgi:hypothetical protein